RDRAAAGAVPPGGGELPGPRRRCPRGRRPHRRLRRRAGGRLMAVTARRRLIPALALLAGGLAGPASGAPWGAFGGDPGRAGHQPAGGGVAPLELLWADTGAG